MAAEEQDCTEGCGEDCKGHKWEIEPHPRSHFDVYVCDDDDDALEVLLEAAEQAWDQCGDGMERTIKIRRRPSQETRDPGLGWPFPRP